MELEQLLAKQQKERETLERKLSLESKLLELTGILPSIISPDNKPFATFYPKTREEYEAILKLEPTDNFILTFASKDPVYSHSPYSVHWSSGHNFKHTEATVKFNTALAPIWVKMPVDLLVAKFSFGTDRGEHRGFGNYDVLYTMGAIGGSTIQNYAGGSRVMYALKPEEAETLYKFITYE